MVKSTPDENQLRQKWNLVGEIPAFEVLKAPPPKEGEPKVKFPYAVVKWENFLRRLGIASLEVYETREQVEEAVKPNRVSWTKKE